MLRGRVRRTPLAASEHLGKTNSSLCFYRKVGPRTNTELQSVDALPVMNLRQRDWIIRWALYSRPFVVLLVFRGLNSTFVHYQAQCLCSRAKAVRDPFNKHKFSYCSTAENNNALGVYKSSWFTLLFHFTGTKRDPLQGKCRCHCRSFDSQCGEYGLRAFLMVHIYDFMPSSAMSTQMPKRSPKILCV